MRTMMAWALLALVMTVGTPMATAAEVPGAARVSRLRCEARENPVNVETQKPRLSWVMESEVPGQRQTAYQVLAASSAGLLEPGEADLWDSGRVGSAQSIHVEYRGKALRSNQLVFWTVRVWDKDGKATAWATPSRWGTALMDASEWRAKWVTDETPQGAKKADPIARAKWVWYPEKRTTGIEVDAPPGARAFRKRFTLPAGAKAEGAVLRATADNDAEWLVNGQRAGRTDDWHQLSTFDIGRAIKPGAENVLEVVAINGTNKPNPAGVVAAVSVPVEGGEDFVVVSDGTWESADSVVAAAPPKWVPAKVVADWGGGPWHAATTGELHPPLPIFRKTFTVEKPVRRAVVHVSGLGHYKMRMNGRDVGDHFLEPAWSNYDKTVYYNTFDVTPLLRQGENAVGVLVGRSYYATKGDRRLHGKVEDRPPVVIAQVELQYEDGTTGRVVTDESWRWVKGPYVHCSILGGPDYDARLWPDGWDAPGFDDSAWKPARPSDVKLGKLVAQVSPPMRTFEEFRPVSVNEPAPGRYVYDFGQNASATVRLKVKGQAGATLRLTYSEQREGQSPHSNDGKGLIDQSGIRSPNYFQYTLRGGGEETWFCDLFYSGFQYMELTGAVPAGVPNPENKPVVTEIASVHVRSAAETVGSFACANPMYERIDRMIDWSVRSNLNHVLTDCPHREKMGWLEVPHLMWDSMANRYDLSSFGPKVCQDMRDAQRADGYIPTVAPDHGAFNGGFAYTPEWGAAGTLIPWYVYQWYGDRRNLDENFGMMRKYVDYMRSTCKEGLVPAAGLGDWYDYVPGQNPGPSKLTSPELSAQAIFYDCARVVADAAKVLGRDEEEQAYRKLADQIRDDFNKRWYQGDGVYKNNGSCQTANAMALVTGLVEDGQREVVVRALVEDLKKRGYQQTSGDVGFHYLVRALSDNGQADALFRLLNRPELGSYAFLATHGWTSLPEAWDAHHGSSMNHCMLGHIQEFFTRTVAGIQPTSPAFKTVLVKPTPGPEVNGASAKVVTPYGPVSSTWEVQGKTLSLTVTVPPNTTARVELPGQPPRDVEPGTHRFQAEVP